MNERTRTTISDLITEAKGNIALFMTDGAIRMRNAIPVGDGIFGEMLQPPRHAASQTEIPISFYTAFVFLNAVEAIRADDSVAEEKKDG